MTGCLLTNTDPPARQIPLTVLFKSTQCGTRAPGLSAEWIHRPEQVTALTGGAAVAKSNETPLWDPAKEGALWIQMGQQRTGGFHLELDQPTAALKNGVATIILRRVTPGANMFTTQALTAPCLLLKMSKVGVETVDLRDQEGAQLAIVTIPADH